MGAFVVLYICCIEFGMPATALMASAGMVSVVLGIGTNSLVGDIIAGMFMLMEGYVQVGDTIEVHGFDGVPVFQGVTEIAQNGLILKIRYTAKEKDRHRLGREINRRVYMMFVRNNIKIPYQQVTVHESDKTN